MKLLLAIIVATFSQLASAYSVGDKFSTTVPISDRKNNVFYKIPLPKGEWEVAYLRHRTTNSTNQDMVDIGLWLIEDNFLKATVEITAAASSTQTRWTDEPCKIQPTYYKNDYGTMLWTQKCLTLSPITFLQAKNNVTNDALENFVKRGVKHDFNAVRFTYTRYGDLSKMLAYKLSIFPSSYGLDNQMQTNLNASPWYPARVERDIEKSKFIDELTKFSENFVKHINEHYEEKVKNYSPVEFVYPPLNITAKTDGEGAVEVLADKLKKLIIMKDSGLISQQEYEQIRKRILEENK